MNKNFISIMLYTEVLSLEYITKSEYTSHLKKSRKKRLNKAMEFNKGAKINQSFVVDKGHPDGPEIHSVTDNGIIFIINANTKRFITVLLARPNQIRRLYKACKIKPPKNMMRKARFYVKNKYNFL